MIYSPALMIGFAVIILVMMAIDLGLVQKKAHTVSFREAGTWCTIWVTLAMLFAAAIWWMQGRELALQFLAGYVLEQSLSVDNMFVFVLIFHYFNVPERFQPRILHWGILGAIVMRLIFIALGVALLRKFHWMIYVFGALLVYTGVKMAVQDDSHVKPEANPALRLLRRFMPMTNVIQSEAFLVREGGVLKATPLLATLIVVEFSDVIFALDSIPAVIAVTKDPFIVYTSNVFAIMGLRSLYFLLAGLVGMFRYLKLGISLILCFVGVKMLISNVYHVPTGISLAVIGATLGLSILFSWLAERAEKATAR